MVARLSSGAVDAPVRDAALDRAGVMVAMAAREQAMHPLPVTGVRFFDIGERDRHIKIDDRSVNSKNFGEVCDFLDVPPSWMRRAPLDIVNSVAKRMLKEERISDRELIFDERTGSVVGSQPKGQQFVPAAAVLDRVLEALPETDGIYLHETDHAVDVSIVCHSLDIEPKKGDVVRGGLSCLYSEIDVKRSSIRAYSERLICTNGMTHRDFEREFGVVDTLQSFLDEIGVAVQACCDYVSESLEPKFRHAAEFEVNGPQAIRRIFRQYRLPPRYMDAVLAAHAIEDDGTAFGVLQAFTRAANGQRYSGRARLQMVAGTELVVAERAHCSHCYAPI